MKNADYALKIIDKSKVAGKEYMIDNEVEILRNVDHTNIIRLIAEHDTAKELYLIMELITVRRGVLWSRSLLCYSKFGSL